MIKVTYKIKGKSFEEIIKNVKVKNKNIINNMMILGQQTAETMKNTIKQNKKRPQAGEPERLENAIDMEIIQEGQNAIGWGVGNIEKLNREASYWKAVNFGSSHIVGKEFFGFYHPGEDHPDIGHFREGRFFEDKEFGWKMVPKNPIPPMNYIETTMHWLNVALIKITNILKR